MKLQLVGSSFAIRDYFTPHDQERISNEDTDVGSSGPLLLPDQPGPHRHLLLQPTKDSTIYVIDRDRMGKFQRASDAVLQKVKMAGGGYGAMAYWNRHVFFACSDDLLRDYAVENGALKETGSSSTKFANPRCDTLRLGRWHAGWNHLGHCHKGLERTRHYARNSVRI